MCIAAGTNIIRTTSTSTRIAEAIPMPTTLRIRSGLGMNAANTATMIAAAATTTRAVAARPEVTLVRLSADRTQRSRIRDTRNTS